MRYLSRSFSWVIHVGFATTIQAFELDGCFGRKPTDTHYCLIVPQIDTYFYYLSLKSFNDLTSEFRYATRESRGEVINRVLR